jgi:DNA polymerase-3 subunit epsilon
MTPWWQGRMCAFDCESSGVDVESDRIVTAAVVFVGGGIVPERVTLLSDAGGVEIPEAATAIHGVTTEQARADGLPARDMLTGLRAVLEAAINAGHPLVVMNARFDLTMLDRELRRYRLAPLPPAPVVDPMVLDRHLDRFRRGSRKLDALCAHYGATLGDAHDAASDALAAARLGWVIGARGEVVRRVRNAQDGRELARLKREWERVRHDVDALHAAQERWARDQAESPARSLRGEGPARRCGERPDELAARARPGEGGGVMDLDAVVSVEGLADEVEVHVVAAGQQVVLRLGLDVALSLADELTIAAHRRAVRAAA